MKSKTNTIGTKMKAAPKSAVTPAAMKFKTNVVAAGTEMPGKPPMPVTKQVTPATKKGSPPKAIFMPSAGKLKKGK